MFTFNVSSTLPQILPNSEEMIFCIFDAHLWGRL